MKLFPLIPLLFLFIITGCKKEDHITAPLTGITNTAPRALAGADFYVVLPADSATLKGKVIDDQSDIVYQGWKKISGPASHIIDNPGSLQTKVRNLVKGRYEFELAVRDKGGLTGMDTVIVDVDEQIIPASGELIFKDLKWIFPWYATIEVKGINWYPAPKKVFIQRGNNPAWIEVKYVSPNDTYGTYEYFISTSTDDAGMYNYGSLYIFYYGSITDDTPQVKIQF
jgi:hypothetical protein